MTPENMVSRLARRLEKNPDDLEGWLRLGKSYSVLEQFPLAVRAYQRANELGDGKNAEALLGMGEALVLNDQNELDGRGGRYIEQALALDPKNGAALFYGGAAAVRRGDFAVARQRFADLLSLDPPANVRPVLEEQIALLDQKIAEQGAGGSGAASAQGGPESRMAGAAPAQSASPETSRGSPPRTAAPASGDVPPVKVRVTLSSKFSSDELSASPLFVIVRDPRQAGPPLAVKRLAATFPQTVELTTADSMLPSHTFKKGQLVEVVARVSKSGSPTATKGDPLGLAAHQVGEGGVVDIQIEHVSP